MKAILIYAEATMLFSLFMFSPAIRCTTCSLNSFHFTYITFLPHISKLLLRIYSFHPLSSIETIATAHIPSKCTFTLIHSLSLYATKSQTLSFHCIHTLHSLQLMKRTPKAYHFNNIYLLIFTFITCGYNVHNKPTNNTFQYFLLHVVRALSLLLQPGP